MDNSKIPWVGCETLTWFCGWCRDHGIPGDNGKLRDGIIGGVFAPAAVAVPDTALGHEGKYHLFIFPARLEKWAEENAIEIRTEETQ